MKPTEVEFIAIEREDGGVSIMQFVTKSYRGDTLEFEREATDEAINKEIAKSQIKATRWHRTSLDEIPADRTFRDAWIINAGKIEHDMAKAKEIQRENMSKPRVQKAALDVADVAKIDAATTTDELKAVWPDILKGP